MSKTFNLRLAPEKLWQSILPQWFQGAQFGVINVDLGLTPHPEVEQAVLDEVGTYGRQIGRMGDALEVLIRRLPMEDLSPEERDAIDMLKGQLAAPVGLSEDDVSRRSIWPPGNDGSGQS